MKIRLSPELLQKIPGIRVGVFVVKNIKNNRKNSTVANLLRGVGAEKKGELKREDRKSKITTHLKQTTVDGQLLAETHLLESMLRKITQGKELKSENNAQDVARYLSLKYLVPALGSDLDQTIKDIEVGFTPPKKGKKAVDFNFTPDTLHMVMWFVDIGLMERETFEKLPSEFAKTLIKYCGGTIAENFLLSIDQPEADLNYVSERETQYAIQAAEEAEVAAKKAKAEQASGATVLVKHKPTPKPAKLHPTIKHQLEEELSSALKDLTNEPVKIEKPKDKTHGDYSTNIALKLAKAQSKSPKEMAEEIQNLLPKLPYISKVQYAEPGFLNFTLSQKYLRDELARVLKYKEHYGRTSLGQEQKIMVEFSQPNIAKPLGVHHLLSTLIGQALANILEFCHYSVIAANYLGDWGTQFGKLIYAYKNWGDRETVEKDPINELLRLYVRFHNEAEEHPSLEEKAREEFKKLEEGDTQNNNMWRWIRAESIKDLDRIYSKLGIHFQEVLGESMYGEAAQKILEEGKQKGIFIEGEEGAFIVKFDDDKMPPYVVQKGDGTTLYSTRDIASMKDRLERLHPKKLIYVVDVAQSLHFKQLFATAEKFGFNSSESAEFIHVAFGRMSMPEGRMSTRKGTVVLLDELIAEGTERAAAVVAEKSQALTDVEKDFIAEGVALGAIKYHILSQNRETNLTFDWDRMLSLDGNTAPYLQYSYARAASILRKATNEQSEFALEKVSRRDKPGATKGSGAPKIDESQIDLFTLVAEHEDENSAEESTASELDQAPTEDALTRLLVKFPEVLEAAAEMYKPNLICNYLFELAQNFNSFYQEVQVLNTQDPDQRTARLNLVAAFGQVLKNGLHLLGITVFEKM